MPVISTPIWRCCFLNERNSCIYNYSAFLRSDAFSHNFLGPYFKSHGASQKVYIYIENFIVKVLKSCKSQLFSPSACKLADHFQGNGGAENKRLGHLESKLMARACGCVFLLFFRQGLHTICRFLVEVCASKTAAASLHSNNIIPRDGNMAHVRARQYVCDSDSWC